MMKTVLACTTALAMVPMMAHTAYAAEAAPAQAQANADAPIIVTAERRALNVQDMPVSIVAMNAEMLRDRGVGDLNDLQSQVPSLSFVDNGNSKFLNIRGVGLTEAAPNQSVAVAVHLDGAYIAREFTFNDAFFDVETVEVLRGPQGTYSGQNASGGAIFINSAKPSLTRTNGFAEVTLGNYARKQFSGAVSTPLTDTLAVRVSLQAEARDSFYTNRGPTGSAGAVVSSQPGNLNRFLGRVQLLWKPVDSLELRLIHQYSNVDSDGIPRNAYTAANLARPYVLNYDTTDTLQRVRYHRTTGAMRWDVFSGARLNVNASYQETRNDQRIDSDRTSTLVDPTVRQEYSQFDIRDRYFTGEVNLMSSGSGPFEWTVGATTLDYRQKAYLYTPKGTQIAAGNGTYMYLDAFRQNTALFAEVGYQFGRVQVKAGARYNHEVNGFYTDSYRTTGIYGAPSSYFTPPYQRFKNVTGRVLVNWKPSDDHLIYGTVSRGYKPGGITPTGDNYDSETVTNFELGWKGEFLDRKVTTSVSAFYMKYDGFQASIATDPDNPTTRDTKNINNTEIKGVEAQLAAHINGLHADVSFSVLDAKFGNLTIFLPVGAYGNTTTLPVNVGGRQVNYAPKFSAAAGLGYDIAMPGGTLTPSVRVSHTASQWSSFFQLPYHRMDARTLVDLRLTYKAERNWKLQAYVTNLFDKTYIAVSSTATDGIGAYGLGSPRQFGAALSYTF
ncbi:TonB-dependent receptor [Novosphingobium sp. FSY-8]|uniref:TonB-dependent receptor n=1 Tax=Novosphingobium ovatum TaxID=1908523 RepID=A0ABW9X9Z4_9SPHN|nr:TonB-dependent receptor [Novosphingobium ovatum]NBC35348.1 TonB-dependent receptor [Novosphingobium ovatum]